MGVSCPSVRRALPSSGTFVDAGLGCARARLSLPRCVVRRLLRDTDSRPLIAGETGGRPRCTTRPLPATVRRRCGGWAGLRGALMSCAVPRLLLCVRRVPPPLPALAGAPARRSGGRARLKPVVRPLLGSIRCVAAAAPLLRLAANLRAIAVHRPLPASTLAASAFLMHSGKNSRRRPETHYHNRFSYWKMASHRRGQPRREAPSKP